MRDDLSIGTGISIVVLVAGVVRLAADPDYVNAEFAIIVRSDLKGLGIGWELMQHLIQYADAEGLRALQGNVLAANTRMLRISRDLGFEIAADPDDPALYRIRLELPRAAEACRHRLHPGSLSD